MTNPDYQTRGLIVSHALAYDWTLRVEFDSGTHDLVGRDLFDEWDALAPGEAFEILGRVDDDTNALHEIDWHAHDDAPAGHRVGRVGLETPSGDIASLPAYVSAWTRWNGFALPLFTREALIAHADTLRAIFSGEETAEDDGYTLTFDADGFPTLIDNGYPEDGSLVVAREVDGRTLYSLGGGGFVWQDA